MNTLTIPTYDVEEIPMERQINIKDTPDALRAKAGIVDSAIKKGRLPGARLDPSTGMAKGVKMPVPARESFARSAAKGGIGLAGLNAAVTGFDTDTEQYAKRLGLENTKPGLMRDLAVRGLGVASDLGNAMTGGLAGGLFRDKQEGGAAAMSLPSLVPSANAAEIKVPESEKLPMASQQPSTPAAALAKNGIQLPAGVNRNVAGAIDSNQVTAAYERARGGLPELNGIRDQDQMDAINAFARNNNGQKTVDTANMEFASRGMNVTKVVDPKTGAVTYTDRTDNPFIDQKFTAPGLPKADGQPLTGRQIGEARAQAEAERNAMDISKALAQELQSADPAQRLGAIQQGVELAKANKAAGATAKQSTPAQVATAEWLVKNGVAKNPSEAWQLVGTAKENSREAAIENLAGKIMSGGVVQADDAIKQAMAVVDAARSKAPAAFMTEADLDAAAKAGTIKPGDKVILNGVSGVYRP